MHVDIETESMFDVPFTRIVKIELCASVKAKSKEEAIEKVRNEEWDEVDEYDAEVIATDINPADATESEENL